MNLKSEQGEGKTGRGEGKSPTQTPGTGSDCGGSISRSHQPRGSRSEQLLRRTRGSEVRQRGIHRAIQASKRSYRDIRKSYQDIRSNIRPDKPEECGCHHRGHAANTEPSRTCSFAASLSSLHRGKNGEDDDDGNASQGSESRVVTGAWQIPRSFTDAEKQKNSTAEHEICLFDEETAAENVR